jgi:hypothetical protein
MIKELPIEFLNLGLELPEVFIYVHPLTGKHAKFKAYDCLAVFVSEEVGRSWEKISKTLRNQVGHYVEWGEMLTIAQNECQGQYEFIRDTVK